MRREDGTNTERTAAEWYVALDARNIEEHDAAGLDRWLAQPGHADALARCDAAVSLASALEREPSLAWAFDEAKDLAARRRGARSAAGPWYRRPAPAWIVAGLSMAVAVLAVTLRPAPPALDARPAVAATPAAGPAAQPAVRRTAAATDRDLGSVEPVVLMPGEIVVDARSIAVLPFSSGADADSADTAAIANQLYVDVVDQLAAIPGLYVVDGPYAASYSSAGLGPREIAELLGVRGIVEGRVTANGGRLQVALSFTDAADSGRLVHEELDVPIDELTSMQAEITSAVLVALASAAASAEARNLVNEY